MNKGIKRIIAVFLISLLLLIVSTALTLAENGGGTGGGAGNGTGSNGDIALTLTSSSINNDDTNVPLNPTIDLQFNKNVVNLTVKDNNSQCFHLVDSKGNSVTIKIVFPDDQLRSEYKEHVFITPEQNLAQDTKYTLYIDGTLQAKNTDFIDNAHIITFTTGTNATIDVNASLKDLADNVQVYTNKLPITAESYLTESTTGSAADKTAFQFINNKKLSMIIIGAITMVVIVFFVILFLTKRKSKSHSDQS